MGVVFYVYGIVKIKPNRCIFGAHYNPDTVEIFVVLTISIVVRRKDHTCRICKNSSALQVGVLNNSKFSYSKTGYIDILKKQTEAFYCLNNKHAGHPLLE